MIRIISLMLWYSIVIHGHVYKVEYQNPYTTDRLSKQSFFIKNPDYKPSIKKV
jgi:hypothetical protein